MPRAGSAAEEAAARWLEGLGCAVLCRNYVIPGGEIDLIVRDGDTVAFVEVKSSKKTSAPRSRVTYAKQRLLSRAALRYAASHGLMEAPLRFDVVEVTPLGFTRIKNAFPYTP